MEQRIANFSFAGFLPPSMSVTTVRLAQFYDPQQKLNEGRGLKLLHVLVDAIWRSSNESDVIAALTPNYPDVVFLQFLDDGPVVGVGATLDDLKTWMSEHNVLTPSFVDPGNASLGIFFSAAAVPLNMNVDLRSMQVLGVSVGLDAEPDLKQSLDAALLWINSNPPLQ